MRAQGRLLTNATLKKLAGDLRCTAAQLALAWLLAQPGVVTIPKSMTCERVKENFGALDVKLSADVLAELLKLLCLLWFGLADLRSRRRF